MRTPAWISPSDDVGIEQSRENRLQGTRRSLMKAAGAGAGALALGGTMVESARAAPGDSTFQVDLIEGTGSSVVTPLDSTGYSGRGSLIDWKWGDDAQNTAEGADNKTPYTTSDCDVDSTTGVSFDFNNNTASIDVTTNNCSGSIDLTLVCYNAPSTGSPGWDPTEASKQTQYAETTTTVSSNTTTTMTVDIPTDAISQGLLGHWSFATENIDSGTIYDESGNGYNGSEPSGISYTQNTTTAGPSADLNGTGAILISNPGQNPESYTVSMWIKTAGTGGFSALFGKAGSFWCGTGGNGEVIRFDPTDGAGTVAAGSTQIDDNSWHHVVYRISQGENRSEIYVDNALDDGADQSPTASSSNPIGIGGKSDQGDTFDGEVAEVRWYNRALSTSEIDTLYQQG